MLGKWGKVFIYLFCFEIGILVLEIHVCYLRSGSNSVLVVCIKIMYFFKLKFFFFFFFSMYKGGAYVVLHLKENYTAKAIFGVEVMSPHVSIITYFFVHISCSRIF